MPRKESVADEPELLVVSTGKDIEAREGVCSKLARVEVLPPPSDRCEVEFILGRKPSPFAIHSP
jgi:hypothetical protein